MVDFTDVTDPLESLRRTLSSGDEGTVEARLETVVDAYAERIPEDDRYQSRLSQLNGPDAEPTLETVRAVNHYLTVQLAARMRRAKVLRQIGLYASDADVVGRQELARTIDDVLTVETKVSEAAATATATAPVESVEPPGELALGAFATPRAAVTPGTTFEVTLAYRNTGDGPIAGITPDVATSEGLTASDTSLSAAELPPGSEGTLTIRVRAEETGLQSIEVTLTDVEGRAVDARDSVSVRTDEQARAQAQAVRDGFDPFEDREDARTLGGGILGTGGAAAAAYHFFKRRDGDDGGPESED